MPRIEAKRTLDSLRSSGQSVGAEDLRKLILLATGDVEQAERAATEQIAAQLRAGLTPE